VAAAEVPDYVVNYLDQQMTLTLATCGSGGRPHAATLVYVNDGPLLYVWVHQTSETAGQIDSNPDVAFAIDQYTDDWRQTKGVQGTGRCEAVEGEELASVAEKFGSKFPDLRPGATSAVTFFRITPSELVYIDNTRGEGEPDADEYRRESVMGG
jgi:uncharacterized protein YhbP (UPF0306 family)